MRAVCCQNRLRERADPPAHAGGSDMTLCATFKSQKGIGHFGRAGKALGGGIQHSPTFPALSRSAASGFLK